MNNKPRSKAMRASRRNAGFLALGNTKDRNMKKLVRDWTPRTLPGGKYCSPACGGSEGFCRRRDFDKAAKDATALAAQLGDGWEPHVWENLGWHWEVSKGSVVKDGFDGAGVTVRFWRGRYSAEFRTAAVHNVSTQFFADADTAEEAIGLVRQDARTFVSRVNANLAASI